MKNYTKKARGFRLRYDKMPSRVPGYIKRLLQIQRRVNSTRGLQRTLRKAMPR